MMGRCLMLYLAIFNSYVNHVSAAASCAACALSRGRTLFKNTSEVEAYLAPSTPYPHTDLWECRIYFVSKLRYINPMGRPITTNTFAFVTYRTCHAHSNQPLNPLAERPSAGQSPKDVDQPRMSTWAPHWARHPHPCRPHPYRLQDLRP
jgi:hypothetical protein